MTTGTLALQLSDALADAVAHAVPSLFLTTGVAHRAVTATAIGPHELVASDHLIPPGATSLTLTGADGADLVAAVAGRDRVTDLVLLRAEQAVSPLVPAQPGARVGQLVIAAGLSWHGPVAHPGFVTSVSGPHETRSGHRLERLIDTSLAPFSGFSGGPLLDPAGQLVGISSSAIVKGSGRAVPIAEALAVAARLREGGGRRRGYLGLSTVGVVLPSAQRTEGRDAGLLVVSLADEGPAAAAGLLVGDILTAAGGTPLTRTRDLLAVVRAASIGDAVRFSVIRATSATAVEVVVAERPDTAD